MLPHKQIGNPKEEFWLGLIDGIYAISITLIVLELPDLFASTLSFFDKINVEDKIFALSIIIGNSLFNYIFVFLIMYECWCFHRASIKLTGLHERGQNFFNSLLLSIMCLIPATMSLLLKGEVDIINRITSQLDGASLIKFLFSSFNSTPYIQFIYLQTSLFFLILILLLIKAKEKNNEITHVMIESKKRLFIFSILFALNIFLTLPFDLINFFYLIYSNYERKTSNY
tara:strand:- start:57 stop:740 length:684 start_codon:yes stop_codon:yes gene_type:complete